MKKFGRFEDAAKFNWEQMQSFKNRRCLCLFITVCDNPSKCVLTTLQFAHVQTRPTEEELQYGDYSPRHYLPV